MSRAQLKVSRALWKRRVAYRSKRLKAAQKAGDQARITKWTKLLQHARWMQRRRAEQLDTIASRMLAAAEALVGVMEQGGNNRGAAVERIIRANDGEPGEPWCGDFVAWCARQAGSKAVTREWAAVRLLRNAVGVHPTTSPEPGDIVTFTFDHTGIYAGRAGAFIITIEGNTGATGAVSDSKTGGDGVYRKRRPKSLVNEYLHVTR